MSLRSIQEFLDQRVPLIFDGAVGTEIQKAGLGPEQSEGQPRCNEIFNVTRPDLVTRLHAAYFAAGANVVETNTIGGNRVKLAEFGFGARAYEINRAAAVAARNAADCQPRLVFVAGALGPTGYVPSSAERGPRYSFDELAEVYREQAAGLIEGGADMLLYETGQVLLEMRAAVVGMRRAMEKSGKRLPLAVQGTMDVHGRMLLGADVAALLGAVANLQPDIIGLNCSTGPAEMQPHIEKLLALSPKPVSMLPNAGMPLNVDGQAVYSMTPQEFAQGLAAMVRTAGVSVVGGCCGTTPAHIGALVAALMGARVAERALRTTACCLGSAISGVDLETTARPVIIGERLNAQGSRKTKELLLADNWEELHQLAQAQIARRSRLLDLCVAVNERDTEAASMVALLTYLADRVEAGFSLDSTEPSVIEQALKVSAGSVLINSINLEHGADKARQVLGLASRFGCPVIGLTIDDEGMARTAERKLALAARLRDLACNEFGLPPHFLYVDPLVFTLATGEAENADAALCSLEALRRIRQDMPDVRTVMGVSNVSYGLRPAARRVLNNLMLHHATEAGLGAAIFNPEHLDDVAGYDADVRELGDDLLLNRQPDALTRFVDFFEKREAAAKPSVVTSAARQARSPERELYRSVVERDRRNLKALVDENLKSRAADEVLNRTLIPAMAEVGERMATGKMILPFVLQAAEVMKEAVALLEPHLKRDAAVSRGSIVLATVFGDVHDIGKNLVGSILRNQGFRVIDLGKQVPLESIVAAVKREHPDAVGLSALLVTTSQEMARAAQAFDAEGLRVPLLIGGAAVNRAFAERVAQVAPGRAYAGGVFYAKDAFEAAAVIDAARKGETRAAVASPRPPAVPAAAMRTVEAGPVERVEPVDRIDPAFYGTSHIVVWEATSLLDGVDRDRLYKGYWKGGSLDQAAYASASAEQFGPAFAKVREECLGKSLLDGRGYYAFFPVITVDEQIILLDPGDFHTERAAFRMPRQARAGNRSLADYFRPEGDVIGVQVVTLGRGLGDRARELLNKEGEYSLGFYLNGLGNYLVEQLAERLTLEVRKALFIERSRGRRYSFGYPGLPGVEEQAKLFELLGVEERLGVVLTPGFLMDPEHSTMAIFVHHPKAEYL